MICNQQARKEISFGGKRTKTLGVANKFMVGGHNVPPPPLGLYMACESDRNLAFLSQLNTQNHSPRHFSITFQKRIFIVSCWTPCIAHVFHSLDRIARCIVCKIFVKRSRCFSM